MNESKAHKRPEGTEDFDQPKKCRVSRDGHRDMAFVGWVLGTGNHGTGGTSGYECDWNRGVRVTIYLTTGGNLVTHVNRWSCWQGEGEIDTAEAHQTPAEALGWLIGDNNRGTLGPASKEAWEEACDTWAPLAGQDVEAVD